MVMNHFDVYFSLANCSCQIIRTNEMMHTDQLLLLLLHKHTHDESRLHSDNE